MYMYSLFGILIGSVANVGGTEVFKCADNSPPVVQLPVIPGVIGAPSSVTSIQVATLLKLFEIPQVVFFFFLILCVFCAIC